MRRNRSSGNLATLSLSASALHLSQLEGGGDLNGASETSHLVSKRRHLNSQRTIKLKRGVTAYSVYGPPLDASRGVVVCVHGLTLASYVFHDLANHLARNRWHVVTYDLYGRGGSKLFPSVLRDKTCLYDDDFYVSQLQEFLVKINVWNLADKQHLSIVGTSLGGAIATVR